MNRGGSTRAQKEPKKTMLPRRIATFIIGAWIGCALLMAVQALVNTVSAAESLAVVSTVGKELVETAGVDTAAHLMQFQASEQLRRHWYGWEETQGIIGLVLAFCLAISGRGKMLSLLLCGGMLAILIFQHLGVTPDLQLASRNADFTSAGSLAQQELWKLTQLYGGLETVKLLMGGVLASYLFVAQSKPSGRRRSRKHSSSEHFEMEAR